VLHKKLTIFLCVEITRTSIEAEEWQGGFFCGISRSAGFGEGTPQQDHRKGENEQ